jgi:CHAD domain-containing protein
MRDLDVLLARYRQQDEGVSEGTLQRLAAQRSRGVPAIEKLSKRWRKRRYDRKMRRFIKGIRWRGEEPEPTILEAARRWLWPACDRFLAAAAAQPRDAESLHRLRIRAKELRYAMEIFAEALPAFFRDELYATVEILQEHLGRINDHATARRRFLRWKRETHEGEGDEGNEEHEAAAERELAQLEDAIEAFRAWWTAERAEEFRARFVEALMAP